MTEEQAVQLLGRVDQLVELHQAIMQIGIVALAGLLAWAAFGLVRRGAGD